MDSIFKLPARRRRPRIAISKSALSIGYLVSAAVAARRQATRQR
jgi:hypothetical protein